MKDKLYELIDKKARWGTWQSEVSGQYVILVDGKRIGVGNKDSWSLSWAKTMANRMINPLRGNKYLQPKQIAKELGVEYTLDFWEVIREAKRKWFQEHVRIIPLRTYMKMEANRSKV